MDVFKKYGGFIELGGFGFIILGIFFNFVGSSYGGSNLLEKPFIGWGVLFLIACLAGGAIAALSSVKPDLLDKPNFKIGKYISDFGPAFLAYNIFVIAFALGLTFATAESLIHCQVGFYFVLLGSLEVMIISILRKIKFKTAPVQPVMQQPMGGQPYPQQPMGPAPMQQPVMGGQPMPQQPMMNQQPPMQAPMGQPVMGGQPYPQQPMGPGPVNPPQN